VEPEEALRQCLYRGATDAEKSALSLMDSLLHSHAELCATLRLAGRRLLSFEKPGDGSLESIRKVLKRADHLRKALNSPNELPETLNNGDELVADTSTSPSEHSDDSAVNDGPIRKSVQRRSRLVRPRAQRVLRFPTGGKVG
jgi:hypothetical protein